MGIRIQHLTGAILLPLLAFLPLYHAALPPPTKDNLSPFLEKTGTGTYKRMLQSDNVPPSLTSNPATKDVTIDGKTKVTARLIYPGPNPSSSKPPQKHPLLIYFHGGAFCIGSAYSNMDSKYLYHLSTESKSIILTVEYRLFPPTPLPGQYYDAWAALQWALAQKGDPWISPDYVDAAKIYVGGDSSGGNIAHNLLMRAGKDKQPVRGGILAMPYFLSNELRPKGPEGLNSVFNVWPIVCPKCVGVNGMDDPCINPMKDPKGLSGLAGSKLMVYLAGDDVLRPFGQAYADAVKGSGWKGVVKVEVAAGETHVFHVMKPDSKETQSFIKNVAAFINSA